MLVVDPRMGPEGATEADRERLDDEDLDRPYGR